MSAEFYDEEHSDNEDRYDTIGDIEAEKISESGQTDRENVIVGNVNQFIGKVNDILFVVYTERIGWKKNRCYLPYISQNGYEF